MQGLLAHRNIKVPQEKLCSEIHRVDHTNTVSRQSTVVSNRVYSTPHPNNIWHLDGNHKMIYWRLVMHAGVDGFQDALHISSVQTTTVQQLLGMHFRKG